MRPYFVALATCVALSACGGSDAVFGTDGGTDGGTGTGGGTDTGNPINSDRTVPPGTASPSPAVGIFRTEATSTDSTYDGNGFASDISYNSTNDTFTVDNLGFDGDNTYSRGSTVGSLGPFAVYEADAQYLDSFDGAPINQFTHRAVYGVSTSGNTQFAIVRTGAYVGYGFGGFIYQRDNSVTLPTTGQAQFSGQLAGLRDYNGTGGLEYTTGDVVIAIDFDDFNDATGTRGDAVRGSISNRRIYDINGNDVTANVISRVNAENNTTLSRIPTATFTVGPGAMDDNGEIIGTLQSYYTDSNGQTQIFEEGNYYAIVSGDNVDEIVGVVVLETTKDPMASSVRETSGFIVYN
ncbi:hypothetical protein [Ruegeria aquimaris]|uniref:Transferrin-binding protein B C-lobe/N-lobe beta barrel domain-containing protein n=1 Tax=Ruegeria aquimaris TaxID=2984333 RepID=A0ABT3AEU6_9RHOB|nr:hypothetical protein [Ruegeria sp. XHP0148]MCV2887184.1 hypothetical protein [Ruegeria sp. XHP0148]